jgi:hypothetical protein
MVVGMEVSVRERAGVSVAGIPGANGDARTVGSRIELGWQQTRPDRVHTSLLKLN